VAGRVLGIAKHARGFGVGGTTEFAEMTGQLGAGIVSPFTGLNPADVASQLAAAGQGLPAGLGDPLARVAAQTKVQDAYRILGATGGILGEVNLRTLVGLKGTAVATALKAQGMDLDTPEGLLEAQQRFGEMRTVLGGSPEGRMMSRAFNRTLGQFSGGETFVERAILREGTEGSWQRARMQQGGNLEATMAGVMVPPGDEAALELEARALVKTGAGGKITAEATTPTEARLTAADRAAFDLGEAIQHASNEFTRIVTDLPGFVENGFAKFTAAVVEVLNKPYTPEGGGHE